MYCLNMLAIALELAEDNPAYEDMASKFLEHFVYIAHAMNDMGGEGVELWNEEDGFFYDVLHLPDGDGHAAEGPVARGAGAALRGAGPRAGEHRARCPSSSAG